MHILKKLLILIFTVFIFGCEKNDLCDGVDLETPRLHITLLDQFDVESKKPITYVKAYISGEETFIEFQSTAQIYLPLIPDNTQAVWVLEFYNSSEENKELIGIETIKFTYIPEYIYISKACGFKSNFTALSYSRVNENNTWAKAFNVLTTNVTNEEDTHLQLFY